MRTNNTPARAYEALRSVLTRAGDLMPSGGGLHDEDWIIRHRLLTWTLLAGAVGLTIAGLAGDRLDWSWLLTMMLIALCLLAAMTLPRRRWPSCAVALGLTGACTDLVMMFDGLTEAHFSFFVAVGALALYRDWVPFGVFLSATMAGHAAMGWWLPMRMFDHPDAHQNMLRWAVIHVVAVLLTAVSQVVAWRLTEAEEQRAGSDALTGLLSRDAFRDDLGERTMSEDAQVSVIYLDLDRFKAVNDAHGHQVGDEVLRAFAARLGEVCPPDAVPARLGADEFAVAIGGAMPEVQLVAQAIVDSCDDPFSVSGLQVVISVSAGVSTAVNGERAEAILWRADMAMYAAKGAGRNRVCAYDDSMRVASEQLTAAEHRLREALAGELSQTLPVWFQPIVSLDDRRVVGAEALVRLRTADGRMVSPAEFIPVAEETGMVIPLGVHVLRTALAHLMRWGTQLAYVSVNVSPRQLAEAGFVAVLARELADSGLGDPSRLVLEITETAALETDLDLENTLRAIKALGVRIALDDFGTGYSSLTWLQSIPADIIKLDRSFVAGLAGDPDKAAIISAVLWLAKALGMSAIAEGVEEVEDAVMLTRAGCPAAQGYLFAKPMEARDFDELLAEHGPSTGPAAGVPTPLIQKPRSEPALPQTSEPSG